jgi:hypothetical protein
LKSIIDRLPAECLSIFQQPPYDAFGWTSLLQKAALPGTAAINAAH